MENRLRLPPLPKGASGSGRESSQGRMLTEVNGVPVWVNGSKISGAAEARKNGSQSSDAKALASRMRRLLGI